MLPTTKLGGFGATQAELLRLLLRNKSGLTVDQIAEGLSITRTAVNQHLASLERDGYVMRSHQEQTGGRPSRIFALSERGMNLFPKNYDMFSLKAFEAMIEMMGRRKTYRLLEKLGQDMGAELGASLASLRPADKAPAIAEVMQSLGFDASANASKPEITAYNCIYHELAKADPEICRLDLAFLRTASGGGVDHASCMAKGDNACRFVLKKCK
ncbi:helix-turn-helix transcriptional regulator [Hyphococcus sp.]|uniref:helix-turn-helix transcriptional regulator n=1 Tax=Hyphococcus sp. TaxID=2038636 RepID=UPI00208BDB2E|nr:MAG: transcriptional regulator [Marinicaulis sp.]